MADSTDLTVPADAPPVQLVDARWIAHFEAQLPSGQILIPGETVVQIPEPEAIASENWEVVSDDDGKVTRADLVKEAEGLGIEVSSRAKKADVEELIAERRQEIADEEAAAAAGAPQDTDEEPGDEATTDDDGSQD
jgi:hypothetical protein